MLTPAINGRVSAAIQRRRRRFRGDDGSSLMNRSYHSNVWIIVRFVTGAIKVAAVVAVACTLISTSQAAPPQYVPHFVAFVTLFGKGHVTSTPKGIDCPPTCRALFPKNAHVVLQATPAAGWTFVKFGGYCMGTTTTCGEDLIDPHDCAGPLCPIGAFGSRAYFVQKSSQ
jgi:hypothetical protein